ncbi:hypothetical protein GPECTOR_18g112 [Gonium pectorale]|uniref:Lon N-terminal domain-containing protein n=1 Tax=Gonium pectorale TaxID=33097 RepID=A0A150GJL2_GONPE|nr:hypothetical protein GPECTOR_18g112 [Gonium pectorale]|eukprot:KXZ49954.1 hypothetical protein GPECTOR_18g112 [Gonium pectorale]
MGPERSPVAVTHLRSVLRARRGGNAFAAATVIFGPSAADAGSGAAAADGAVPAARHAAKVALLALRGALGSSTPPSAVLLFASVDMPRPALAALTGALSEALGTSSSGGGSGEGSGRIALIGCSSRLRLPDERRAGTFAGPGGSGGSGSDGLPGAAVGGGARASPPQEQPFHVTLAGAHLPDHEVHVVRCDTGSLPRLPHLAEAIRGVRPPSFLLLAGGDSLGAELLNRLENLFPGSCVGAGIASQQSSRERRLVLVGPSGSGGGDGGSGAAAGAAAAGPQLGAATSSAAEAPRRAGDASAEDGAGGGDGGGLAGASGRTSGDDPLLAAAVAAAASRGPASELEGPFQRMLLDRDGSASSSSSDGGGPESASRSGAAATSSASESFTAGRRRRGPPTTAASPGASQSPAPAAAAGDGAASGSGDDDAAAAALAASLEGVLPPFILVGDQLHTSGGALLALYPRERIAVEEAAAAAAAAPGGGAAAGRLEAGAADLFARVALGTDHLHHVALRGHALGAISAPATGPEPASPQHMAPENPYYWWPAAATHPAIEVDLHQDLNPRPALTPDPDPRSAANKEHDEAAAATAAAKLAAASEAVREAIAALCGSGSGGSGGEDGAPSDAALATMTEGLQDLPLFPLEGVILFPGQTIQLRVFEKRYRALMRAVLEQGGAFGLCWRGTGTTAVVRSYQSAPGGQGDMMMTLEGGMRFSYSPDDLAVLPATYGINVARRAEYVLDELPASQEDVDAVLAAARGVIDSIAGHLEAATAPSVKQSARTFANALHFASSEQQPALAEVVAAAARASSAAATGVAATAAEPDAGPGAGRLGSGAEEAADTDGGSSDAELLAADIAEAKAALDPETASLLSLYLAPHIPVHLESLRRRWFTSRSALWRLQQEASWLRGSPRVCLAAASSVLRLPREHPLRVMLGLSRVAAST